MDIPRPTTIADVITDGALAQSSLDRAFAAELGSITGVEFNLPEESDRAQVRINRGHGAPFDTTGTVIAWIRDGQLTWESTRGAELGIPELRDPRPLSDGLISAARTLHGNAPAFIAPFGGRGNALVAVHHSPEPADVRTDLIEGLPTLRPGTDLGRATAAYAAFRGLGIRLEEERIAFSDGTTLNLHRGRPLEIAGGLSLRDVRADAAFFSAEHQLLLDAISPAHEVTFNPRTATALVAGRHEAAALVLARITGDTWRWEPAAAGLARFGFDNGLLPLTTPEIPVAVAEELDLVTVAKPVLGHWTDVEVPGPEGSRLILLLDHPALRLPPASVAAVDYTLRLPLDPAVDAPRAVRSYAGLRQVPFDGVALTVQQRRIRVDFDGARLTGVTQLT